MPTLCANLTGTWRARAAHLSHGAAIVVIIIIIIIQLRQRREEDPPPKDTNGHFQYPLPRQLANMAPPYMILLTLIVASAASGGNIGTETCLLTHVASALISALVFLRQRIEELDNESNAPTPRQSPELRSVNGVSVHCFDFFSFHLRKFQVLCALVEHSDWREIYTGG